MEVASSWNCLDMKYKALWKRMSCESVVLGTVKVLSCALGLHDVFCYISRFFERIANGEREHFLVFAHLANLGSDLGSLWY